MRRDQAAGVVMAHFTEDLEVELSNNYNFHPPNEAVDVINATEFKVGCLIRIRDLNCNTLMILSTDMT